jgi:hypothetical protein
MTNAEMEWVLEKVELAARRAVSEKYPYNAQALKDSLMHNFAEHLYHMIKELKDSHVD